MKLRSLKEVHNLKGVRVFVRCGFDVPLKNGNIEDKARILEALPTLRYLLKKQAKLVLATKIGRPEGKRVSALSAKPLVAELSKLLKKKIQFIPDILAQKVNDAIADMKNGDIMLFENLRFYKEEQDNDRNFAKHLASLADIYVNEAFSNSHRKDASMIGVPKYLPSYAGFHLIKEVVALEKFIKEKRSPVVAVIGGVKVSSKLSVILHMLENVDHVLLGGALANTVLVAKGISVGKSFVEKNMIQSLQKIVLTNPKLHIPVDAVMSESLEKPKKMRVDAIADVDKKNFIVDIGPDTIQLYKNILQSARSVFFAGPMGKFEIKEFSRGTFEILRAAKKVRGYTLAGGGDTLHAIHLAKAQSGFDYISTAGGATLMMLEGKMLPALKPLLI